jgi:hypothetical protein
MGTHEAPLVHARATPHVGPRRVGVLRAAGERDRALLPRDACLALINCAGFDQVAGKTKVTVAASDPIAQVVRNGWKVFENWEPSPEFRPILGIRMASRDRTHVGRRHFFRGAFAAIVFGLAARASASPRSLAELSHRFQELRQRRKAKKAGELDRSVDGFGGELHEVMTDLGKRLGVAGTAAARVLAIMGEPDERKAERWAYQWRGWHDYLYFEIANDRVVRADWYMAGE